MKQNNNITVQACIIDSEPKLIEDDKPLRYRHGVKRRVWRVLNLQEQRELEDIKDIREKAKYILELNK